MPICRSRPVRGGIPNEYMKVLTPGLGGPAHADGSVLGKPDHRKVHVGLHTEKMKTWVGQIGTVIRQFQNRPPLTVTATW